MARALRFGSVALACFAALSAGCGSEDAGETGEVPQDTGVADSAGDTTVADTGTPDTTTSDTTVADTGSSDTGTPAEAGADTRDSATADTGDASVADTAADTKTDGLSDVPMYQFMVTVEGTGGVTGSGAIDCGATCSDYFEASKLVTVTAKPALGHYFVRWENACAGFAANRTCTLTQGSAGRVAKAIFAPIENNIVFVSSIKYNAALGGTDGADAKCNALAGAVGLPQTFKAFLSTTSADAKDRLGSARGFMRTDGQPITDTQADLLAGKIRYPIRVDETGAVLEGDEGVWTGTIENGTLGGRYTCENWTSTATPDSGVVTVTYGNTSGGPVMWTSYSTQNGCAGERRLYCVMTDKTVALSPLPTAGKVAFLSNGTVTGSQSQSAADTMCQTEATTAGLGAGPFKAYRSTKTETAVSRFPSTSVFVRPDGTAVGTAPQLANPGVQLQSGIWQLAGGAYYTGVGFALTGSVSSNVVGDDATSCSGWGSTAGTAIGGAPRLASSQWFNAANSIACDVGTRVYCLDASTP